MAVPIKNLVEVRYSEKSYSYVGSPCIFIGTMMLAATAGLGISGHLDETYVSDQELLLGVAGGISIYYLGKLLKLIGARFGSDIIYENFDRLDRSTKNLILESISSGYAKKDKQSQFLHGPEGRKKELSYLGRVKSHGRKNTSPKEK